MQPEAAQGLAEALLEFLDHLGAFGAGLAAFGLRARCRGQEGERERYLLRAPRGDGAALAHALAEVQGVRSARKASEHVRVQLDPLDLV